MNWELLKAPILATVKFTGLMPGIPSYSTRILLFISVILPFLPIYKFAETFEDETIYIFMCGYFLFYLIVCIVFTQQIKRIGKRWPKEEYENLTSDQITFPFMLVMIVNATGHFCLFYVLTSTFN